jgi:hypothetical protein
MWLFLESLAQAISVFCSLMIWPISLFAQLFTLMLFKFSRRFNLPDLYQFPQISTVDNVESGIASIDPSDATLSDEFPYPDNYLDAPEDQIRCVPSLDHNTVDTFAPYPAEIPLDVQIMQRILDDQ